MNKELKEFMKNNCRECNEPCEKGIVETKDFIRCIDKNIIIKKKGAIYDQQGRSSKFSN